MSKKKTPWFPACVKPVRVGLYEARYPETEEVVLRYWDGSKWKIDQFYLGETLFGTFLNDKWRGLAQPPKGAKQ